MKFGSHMNMTGQTKSEQTKSRILLAATDEFAAFGIAGGRVDRIARAAKANKSLIYDYFGSKEGLFTAVLEQHLTDVYQTVRFAAGSLSDYAVGLFDFAMDHPHLMRLWMWNGLERSREWPLKDTSNLQSQIKAIQLAQSEGTVAADYPPEFLLTLILTLASAWTTANPFGMSIAPDAGKRRASLRKSIANAIEQLCRPQDVAGDGAPKRPRRS